MQVDGEKLGYLTNIQSSAKLSTYKSPNRETLTEEKNEVVVFWLLISDSVSFG